MKHVKEIREMLDHGQTSEAGEAIDILLELGPHNTEALKLKALIFQQQGRFNREYEIWERVVSIDPEDEDAITYFRLRHIEDREHFYFTDDLPGGGRRFLAYPSALIRATFLALIGCVVFLVFTRFTIHYPGLENPLVLLPVFVISVLIPWIGTILVWVKSLRSISLTQKKFEVSTRFRTHSLDWKEIESIYLAHSFANNRDTLSLVLMPKNKSFRPIEIDLSFGTTSIRARSFLIKEINTIFGEPIHTDRSNIKIDEQHLLSF